MKGNQGLEALAALCSGSGQHNMIPAVTTNSGSTNTTNNRAGNSAAPFPVAPSDTSSSDAATLVMKQAAELLVAACSNSTGQADLTQMLSPFANNNNALSQQRPQGLATATQCVDPSTLALFLSAQQQQQTVAPPAAPSSADIVNIMQQLAMQQYLQSLNNAHQQHQQAALVMTSQLQQKGLNDLSSPSQPNPKHLLPNDNNASSGTASTSSAWNGTKNLTSTLSGSASKRSQASSVMKPKKPSSITSTTTMKPPPSSTTSMSMWNGSTNGAGQILPNVDGASKAAVTASTNMSGGSSLAGSNDSGVFPSSPGSGGDKKLMKRAANRRSAQLSRKRKKQFIEELKEENDDLRRKEMILRAIPDLIVVFDSSGKLGFVSESVGRFIDMSPDELIGTSFWDRLCEDSVRLLKAAFMDSLAARHPDSETAPLGNGVWELRLVDKNSNFFIVSLNGVVHFTGDVPECVCCIRPREGQIYKVASTKVSQTNQQNIHKPVKSTSTARPVSSSDGSRISEGSSGNDEPPQARVNSKQSVVGNESNGDLAEDLEEELQETFAAVAARKRRRLVSGQIVNISDGDSVGVSESGSDD